MRQILLVEDSPMFGRLAKKKIETTFDLPVYWTRTLAETKELLRLAKGNFTMALLDFNLPDAPNGEIIDLVIAEGITSFVFTANMSDDVREMVWSKKVADYVLKDDLDCVDFVVSSMYQLELNSTELVLVVGSSVDYRSQVSELLYIRKYRVINSTDAESAMQILSSYPEIRLVLIDYDLQDKDGCELCREIRRKFAPDYLSIIGFIPEHEKKIGARFIKSGANDFVSKHSPFLVEEFYCRVSQCIETLRLFERIRRGAMEDFLTGLANRRCFFERGSQLFADCQESGRPLSCVMVDIDFFKKINDNYGHAVGDLVIKKMASMLRENAAASDIVCRFGGEEFCILIPDSSRDQVVNSCEKMRARISQVPAVELADKTTLQATVSIGICAEIGSSLESMINTADTLLYQAKAGGRNRVESVPL